MAPSSKASGSASTSGANPSASASGGGGGIATSHNPSSSNNGVGAGESAAGASGGASGGGGGGGGGAAGLGLSASNTLGLPLSGIPSSVYPTDTIKDVAESLGINALKDSVAAALAADVEYRIRELVQDAAKFMRHSKRDQLKTSDIDAALRAKNVEPLYGFLPSSAGRLATSRHTAGPSFRRVQTSSGVPLHYVEDEEIDFEKILDAGPRIGVGRGVGWGAHWLAIEGVQPALPQNPSPADLAEVAGPVGFSGPAAAQPSPHAAPVAKAVAVAGTVTGAAPADAQAVAKPLVKHILSRELQLYYERLTRAIVSPPPEADEDLDDIDRDPPDDGGQGQDTRADEMDVDEEEQKGIVTPPRPGAAPALPLRTFEAKGSGNRVRDAALASLRGDPGLHQLVPYLIQFVGGKVIEVLRGGGGGGGEPTDLTQPEAREMTPADNHMLSVMLSTVHAILVNQHIFIEPYLHQTMPSILSILLTASLAEPGLPSLSSHDLDHPLITAGPSSYSLRAHAAALLAHIVEQHGASYPTLKPRIVATLLKALLAGVLPERTDGGRAGSQTPSSDRTSSGRPGPRASPGTKVGATMGLRRLGRASFKLLLQASLRTDADGGDQTRCPLFWLGEWMDRWVRGEDAGPGGLSEDAELREWQLRPLRREVAGALHSLLPPYVPPSTHPAGGSEDDRLAKLEEAYGAYWARHLLRTDSRARIALEIELGLRGTVGGDAGGTTATSADLQPREQPPQNETDGAGTG